MGVWSEKVASLGYEGRLFFSLFNIRKNVGMTLCKLQTELLCGIVVRGIRSWLCLAPHLIWDILAEYQIHSKAYDLHFHCVPRHLWISTHSREPNPAYFDQVALLRW